MVKRLLAAVVLVITPACMTNARVAPAEYLAQNQPVEMLFVDGAGDLYVLYRPRIVGDQVVGTEVGTQDTVSLPVAGLQEAVVRQKSTGKTALLAGGAAVLVAGAAVLMFIREDAPPCTPGGQGSGACDPTLPDPDPDLPPLEP